MEEPNRKGRRGLAVPQFRNVVVPDRSSTVNNNKLSVALNAQRIIFRGHLT